MNCVKCFKPIPDGSVYCMFCGTPQAPRPRSKKKRGNGQGTVFQLKNGKYIARCVLGYYTDENGKKHVKRVSKVFAKKSDAIASLPSLKQTVERQKDITLHDLYDRYTKSKEYDALSYSQRDKLGYAWNRWKELEFRGIATLTVADIETQIENKAKSFWFSVRTGSWTLLYTKSIFASFTVHPNSMTRTASKKSIVEVIVLCNYLQVYQ